MDRFIKLAIVVAVLFFAVTQGWPWLREELGLEKSPDAYVGDGSVEDGSTCVAIAQDANQAFGDEIRAFSRPPVDLENWEDAERRIRDLLDEAQNACYCSADSCRAAYDALSELADLLGRFDDGFRGARPVPLNAARELNRVNQLLDDAESLARQGS